MQSDEFLPFIEKFNLKPYFKGVFALDKVPKTLKYRHFIIINTDISTGLGIHWFCALKSQKGTIEIFDSLGFSNEKRLKLISNCVLFQNFDLECNTTKFQHADSSSCGKMALYYIIQRMYNLDLEFTEFLEDIFVVNSLDNEILVKNFFVKYFEI